MFFSCSPFTLFRHRHNISFFKSFYFSVAVDKPPQEGGEERSTEKNKLLLFFFGWGAISWLLKQSPNDKKYNFITSLAVCFFIFFSFHSLTSKIVCFLLFHSSVLVRRPKSDLKVFNHAWDYLSLFILRRARARVNSLSHWQKYLFSDFWFQVLQRIRFSVKNYSIFLH